MLFPSDWGPLVKQEKGVWSMSSFKRANHYFLYSNYLGAPKGAALKGIWKTLSFTIEIRSAHPKCLYSTQIDL